MSEHTAIVRTERQHKVVKSWGFEIWIANSPMYCGKMLAIQSGKHTSMHFHVKKHEHIFVHSGTLILTLIEDKITTEHILQSGDSIYVTPGLVHRLEAPAGQIGLTVLYEFSTEHFDSDSHRIS